MTTTLRKILLSGGGIPSWVLRSSSNQPAIFDCDYANSKFWYRGKKYNTEASLLGASGGAASGLTRTFGPYISGSELLSNGGFATDTTGWTGYNGATLASVGGEMEMTSGGSLSSFSQAIAIGVGHCVQLTGTGRRGTSANTHYPFISPYYANLQSGEAGTAISTTSNTDFVDYSSTSTGSNIYAGIRNSSAAGTGTALFDNFSVKECVPFNGYPQSDKSIVIKATTQGSVATECLWQSDINSERARTRIVWTGAHLYVIVTIDNVAQASLDLGALGASTSFTVAASFAQNSFSASLNGGAPVADVSGVCPGVAFMRIGRSFTGETWTGSIERVTVL